MSIHIKAKKPDGTDATVNVTALNLTNMFTGEKMSLTEKVEEITGEGVYNYTVPNKPAGEYELEVCIYQGDQCTQNSLRAYIHFSIKASCVVDAWSDKGGHFIQGENATFYVKLWDADHKSISPNEYSVSLVALKNVWSNEDLTSSIAVDIQNDTLNNITIIDFSTSNLNEGEYKIVLNISKDIDWNLWELWFKINKFQVLLQTVHASTPEKPFPVKENVTFNITVLGNASTTSGTLYIKDNLRNWVDAISPKTFTLQNNQALVNVSLSESGEYTAVAQVGNVEGYMWFRTVAFTVEIDHTQTTHDIRPEDNVTVYFNVKNGTGGEYQGNVTINVTLRRATDWSLLGSVYNGIVLAGSGTENFTFDPNASGNIEPGEYEAEMLFTINESGKIKSQKEYLWFQSKNLDFWAWPLQSNYLPGENITIEVELRWPNGTAISGRNITIEDAYSREKGPIFNKIVYMNSSITGGNGHAILGLRISPEITGWVDIKLKENGNNQVTWAGFNINGYSLELMRDWSKWAFSTNENYTADLYVYGSDGSPAANKSVRVEVYNESNPPENNNPDLNVTMSDTDNNGYSKIEFNCSNLNPGRYLVAILVDNKAAKYDDWIKVESFHVDAWAEGMQTSMDEVSPGEDVKIHVRVEEIGTGNPIQSANVSFYKLHQLPQWEPGLDPYTGFNISQDNQTTDSMGLAELVLQAPQQEGEYVVEINVSHSGYGTNMAEAWFRVTTTFVNWQFMCWNGTDVTTCPGDPYKRIPGDTIVLNVSSPGNNIRVIPFEIKDLWRNTKISLGNLSVGPEMNEVYARVQAPEDEGDYELGFYVYINKSGTWEFKGEYWAWFNVLSSTGLIVDSWVEPHDSWAGRNATIWIDVKNATRWEHVICNISESQPIKEIRNAWSWNLISFDPNNQWVENEEEFGGPGPQGSKIRFTVPENAIPGQEYVAIMNITCQNLGQPFPKVEAWFRVSAFQVSSAMSEVAEPNKTLEYWIKITDVNGTPIQNAIVCQEELVREPEWQILKSWPNCALNHTTDSNGEVIGNITTPESSGEFLIKFKIINGSITQKMERWFRIRKFKGKIILAKDVFVDENVTFNVSVRDGITNDPVANASVNVWIMPKFEEEGQELQPINLSATTDSQGIAKFNLPKENTTSGDYGMWVEICVEAQGCERLPKMFSVRFFNTTISGIQKEYFPGENVTITIHSENSTGSPLSNVNFTAFLFKLVEGECNETCRQKNMVSEQHPYLSTLDDNGNATFNLTINQTHSGITLAIIWINSSTEGLNEHGDEEIYVIITHNSSYNISVSPKGVLGPFSPAQFFEVNVSCNDTNLAIAPFILHKERIGESIPESQMMGQGPETYMESPILIDQSQQKAHLKMLASYNPGNYTAMMMFIERDSEWFGPEDMRDVIFIDYDVS